MEKEITLINQEIELSNREIELLKNEVISLKKSQNKKGGVISTAIIVAIIGALATT